MEITGEYRIPAPRAEVWEALNDAAVLKQCIPGCEELTRESDTELSGRMLAKVGPVKAAFTTRFTLSDFDPPASYRLAGEGKGGAAGFAKGVSDVTLEDDGDETVLRYALRVQVGGKLAQVGSRLINSSARKMANDFFSTFVTAVAPGETAVQPVSPPRQERRTSWLWPVAVGVGLLGVLLWLFIG